MILTAFLSSFLSFFRDTDRFEDQFWLYDSSLSVFRAHVRQIYYLSGRIISNSTHMTIEHDVDKEKARTINHRDRAMIWENCSGPCICLLLFIARSERERERERAHKREEGTENSKDQVRREKKTRLTNK